MKLNTLHTLQAIIAFMFGLGFMVMPVFVLSIIGLSTSADGLLVTRLFGVIIFSICILVIKAKNVSDAKAKNALLTFLVTVHILLLLFCLGAQLIYKMGNIMLWGTDIYHFLFAIGYGSHLFRDAESAEFASVRVQERV